MRNGPGRIVVTPQSAHYNTGASVHLTASPEVGQSFLGWSGDGSGANNSLVVVMSRSKLITANFTKRASLALSGGFNEADDQSLRLTLTGEPGTVYGVETSGDLIAWRFFTTVTNILGRVPFTEPVSSNVPRQFYRALPLP